MKLIDVDALRHTTCNSEVVRRYLQGEDVSASEMAEMFAQCIDDAPVVQTDRRTDKRGEWLKIRDDYGHHYVGQCSRCGCEPLRPFGRSTYNFCPNCGADMRGPKEDTP
jgi:hypothetical protein